MGLPIFSIIKKKVKGHSAYINFKRKAKFILVQLYYRKTARRIRKKAVTKKLKVLFYTNEPQKWAYDSLYKELESSPIFSPLIVVVPRYAVHLGKDDTRMSLTEQYNFYKKKGFNVTYGYENGQYLAIKKFNPDILFYMQLAEIPGVDSPYIVAKYALTAYCPYAYSFSDYTKQYLEDFHRILYVNYVEHELTIKRYESYHNGNSKNCVSVGYPKLDEYLSPLSHTTKEIWKDSSKFKIIYAPHHSFFASKYNTFKWGTFHKNNQIILNLAKEHPETTWIFKPHPMLRKVIVSHGLMTEKEAANYYNEWNTIGTLYDSGDYIELFRTSNLMITDCGSFLAEYIPSGNPIIRLINDEGIPLNELGENFSNYFYVAHNENELLHLFNTIVVQKKDPLHETRNSLQWKIVDREESSAHKIYKDLLARIKIKYNKQS